MNSSLSLKNIEVIHSWHQRKKGTPKLSLPIEETSVFRPLIEELALSSRVGSLMLSCFAFTLPGIPFLKRVSHG